MMRGREDENKNNYILCDMGIIISLNYIKIKKRKW